MPTTTHRETIAASADAVWALVGSFGNDEWMGGMELTCEGDGLGAIRKVTMPTGVVTELCELNDVENRTMGYTILDGNPFPATDYHGTIKVAPIDDSSCELVWSSNYEVKPDADPSQVEAELAVFLKRAARALKRYAEAE